jgi:hypothetical protein
MQTGLTGGLRIASITSLAGLLCVAAMLFGSTPKADAAVYGFCENVHVGGTGYCQMTVPSVNGTYQDYGWGDLHSVCVSLAPLSWSQRCSGGPGQGVYSGTVPYGSYYPTVTNNAEGDNYLHGVYFTP